MTALIGRLEESINSYKEEYAQLISQAEAIKTDLKQVQEKVDRSMSLLKSLGIEKDRWQARNINILITYVLPYTYILCIMAGDLGELPLPDGHPHRRRPPLLRLPRIRRLLRPALQARLFLVHCALIQGVSSGRGLGGIDLNF